MTHPRPTRTSLPIAVLITLSAGLALSLTACKSKDTMAGPDPAAANIAPVAATTAQQPQYATQPTQVLGNNQSYTPQQSSENYDQHADDNQTAQGVYDQADQPPPPLPSYQQPVAPGPGYMWTPGYWGHSPDGYNWVAGAWVRPPYQRALWTPGYWHSNGRVYDWHRGYWGPHVGYYGGVDYGAGYIGTGYYGGYWNNDQFYYNRLVNNLSPGISTFYERPVVFNNIRYGIGVVSAISYNGPGGINYDPRPYELNAMREQHLPPLANQFRDQRGYGAQPGDGGHIIVNHGHPDGFIPGQNGRGHGEGQDHGEGRGHGGGQDHGHGHGGQ